ncbi:MAG: methyl-accepting chemotaxis protein, partial [Leptolyngbyaceae bacterium]|nr:methyl-accepting chemotaxis protein [Leptolyngbyaceae bacterium]
EYVLWTNETAKGDADTIAQAIQNARIDIRRPEKLAAARQQLQQLLVFSSDAAPEEVMSFKILTNARGQTVLQNIQVPSGDLNTFPPLPTPDQSVVPQAYRPVSVPTGIALGDIPIVQSALQSGQPISGMELIQGKTLQSLGLGQQAAIGIRPQVTQNLSEPKQPFPPNTYDIDQGQAGFVSMAVHPIKVNNQVVGTAIVGTLINRNYGLIDKFLQKYTSVSVATVFAQDWRVTTNVPYVNPQTNSPDKTRAIGTRSSRQVAETVLNQGKEFVGSANIVGEDYLTTYLPLYDHRKTLDPQAKPIGMVFVGKPLTQIQADLRGQQLVGYGIGGGILVLVSVVAFPLAAALFRPLQRLSKYAQRIGSGEMGVSIEVTARHDEIGVLTQELQKMASSVSANLKTARLQAEMVSSVRRVEDLNAVFNQVTAWAREFLGVERVVIYQFNPDWSGYIAAESVLPGWGQALNQAIEDACIPESLRTAYLQGRVVPTTDVFKAGFHPEHQALMVRLQIKSNLVTPIVIGDQLFGLLIAHHCAEIHPWQQAEIDFLSQLALQTGLVLDRVYFLEQQRLEAEQQKLAREQLQQRALDLLLAVDPVSRGDLTVRARVSDDEIGTIADSYNATINNLRKIVSQVQVATQQVTATTDTNAEAVQELSLESLQQAAGIATALNQIQEMANSIQLVALNAAQAEAAVQQATQTVDAGDAVMNRTVQGMLAIRETVAETSKKVKQLGSSSEKISQVVSLIGTFAAQTNLLALNASMEAARAGEEGRGFAVVANEVRSLARQSAKATVEIEKLVAEIQAETNEVVAAMESGTEQVVTGTKLVDEARQSLNQIAASSTQINQLVVAIAEAAATQTQASEAVTQTMTEVATIANKTSMGAAEVSDSFKDLLAVAQELQTSVGQFKVS